MTAPLSSRRTILAGLASLPLATLPAMAAPSGTAHRLLALAKSYEGLDREVLAHKGAEAEFDDLVAGFGVIEDEMTEIQATSLVGLMAKARLSQKRIMRDCLNEEFLLSIADDLVRLFPAEAAHV